MVQGSQGNPPNNAGKGSPWWANPGAAPPGAPPTAQPAAPQAPATPVAAQPPATAAPAAPAPASEAFGFGAPSPGNEKYNTEYLSTAIVGERRKTQYIIIGVVALILGAVLWAVLSSQGKTPAVAPEPKAAAAPATPAPTLPATPDKTPTPAK